MRPIIKSCSNKNSYSLRSILVEGEYLLSTNDLLIRGEISPEVPALELAKVLVALSFVDMPPWLFFGTNDRPGVHSNVLPSRASLEPSTIFLFFDPPAPDNGCDIEASKWPRLRCYWSHSREPLCSHLMTPLVWHPHPHRDRSPSSKKSDDSYELDEASII
jgi:hypothetical protein